MPFITPTFEKIRDDLLRDIKNQLPEASVTSDSDFYVRASSIASAMEGIYRHQTWITRQIFPDTSDTEYLELHCRLRHIFRKPANTATGTIVFTGTANAELKAGLVVTRDNLTYTTTEDAKIGAKGKAEVNAIASITGAIGNTSNRINGRLNSTPSGIDSAVIINEFKGGTDAETDAELLDRLLELIRRPPAGGNKYDYKRWAMEVPGVTAAFVYPLRRGLGTVDVIITSNNDLPSLELIQAVQAHIDDLRPVTSRNALVLAPTIKKIDFNIKITAQHSFEIIKQEVINTLTNYMKSLAPGEKFVKSQAEMLVSLIAGVEDRSIILPENNVLPMTNENIVEWLQIGNVTVTT